MTELETMNVNQALETAAVEAHAAGLLWAEFHRDHQAELDKLDAKQVDHLLALVVTGEDTTPWPCTWGRPDDWELERLVLPDLAEA